jgi:hypothetical protein
MLVSTMTDTDRPTDDHPGSGRRAAAMLLGGAVLVAVVVAAAIIATDLAAPVLPARPLVLIAGSDGVIASDGATARLLDGRASAFRVAIAPSGRVAAALVVPDPTMGDIRVVVFPLPSADADAGPRDVIGGATGPAAGYVSSIAWAPAAIDERELLAVGGQSGLTVVDAGGTVVASEQLDAGAGPVGWVAPGPDGRPTVVWATGSELRLTTLRADGGALTRRLVDLGPADKAARHGASRSTFVGKIAVSQDGKSILALMTYCGSPCRANLWLVRLDGSARLLSSAVVTSGWISFSPDGTAAMANIAVEGGAQPSVIDIGSGTINLLTDLPTNRPIEVVGFASARFLDDGRILVGAQDQEKDEWSTVDPLPLSFWVLSADGIQVRKVAEHAYDVGLSSP